jgi:hypothetical protein
MENALQNAKIQFFEFDPFVATTKEGSRDEVCRRFSELSSYFHVFCVFSFFFFFFFLLSAVHLLSDANFAAGWAFTRPETHFWCVQATGALS